MKRSLLLCGMLTLLLFSCKKGSKDNPAPADGEKVPVTFNVSGFTEDYGPLETTIKKPVLKLNADTSSVEKLIYVLFKENVSGYIAYKNLNKSDAGFGVFSEQLAPGNYIAAFVGGSRFLRNDGDKVSFEYIDFWGDTFSKRIPFTVSSAPVNNTVIIDRITNQLVLNIEDEIPADVTKIEFIYTDYYRLNVTAKSSNFGNQTTRTILLPVTAAEIGKTNYKISVYTAYSASSTVTIKYYKNDPNAPYGIKTVAKVIRKPNYRTVLSGKLFTPGNSSFTVQLDENWDEPVYGDF